MRLEIGLLVLDAIRAHARAERPQEACGFLLGSMEGDRILVSEARPVRNALRAGTSHGFRIEPRAVIELDESLRGGPLRLVGFYHSHPRGAPEPSAEDVAMAWPGLIQVIDGRGALGAWRVSGGGPPYRWESLGAGWPVPQQSGKP